MLGKSAARAVRSRGGSSEGRRMCVWIASESSLEDRKISQWPSQDMDLHDASKIIRVGGVLMYGIGQMYQIQLRRRCTKPRQRRGTISSPPRPAPEKRLEGACARTGADASSTGRSMEAICAGTKERHDATHPAKLILQLSHRARKEGCRKACWMRTCLKGGRARYVDRVRK